MKSIICNAQSIQGILDESKTATRRVINPQPKSQGMKEYGEAWEWHRSKKDWFSGVTLKQLKAPIGLRQYSPYGLPGDKLWVRESFTKFGYKSFEWLLNTQDWVYKASATQWHFEMMKVNNKKWTSPLFMPRIASRITLKIEELRVERIQEITDEDTKAEGVPRDTLFGLGYFPGNPKAPLDKREGRGLLRCLQGSYARLWDSINHYRGFGWPVNPWVWVIIFSLDSVGRYVEPK